MEVKITVRFTENSVILTNALYMESCPSGRRSTIGNRVGAPKASPGFKSLTLRQSFHGAYGRRFTLGGVAEWSNAAVSKTVYPFLGYEGSNPSSSASFLVIFTIFYLRFYRL